MSLSWMEEGQELALMGELVEALFGGSATIIIVGTVVILVGVALLLWWGRKID